MSSSRDSCAKYVLVGTHNLQYYRNLFSYFTLYNISVDHQLWHHLTVIDEATGSGSGSVKSTIVTKIRPFMIFMIATTIGAAIASCMQVLGVIGLVSADAAPLNPSDPASAPEYFTAARHASFDLFAPVLAFVYSCCLHYAWKSRSSAEAALASPRASKSLRSARQSALILNVEASASAHGGGANEDSSAAAGVHSVWLEQTSLAATGTSSIRSDDEKDAPVQVVGNSSE